MSVGVSRCSKSSIPVEYRVIQSIYFEAQQRLAQSQARAKADTVQRDSYRSERGFQMFEGEVPWKAPLTSSAFLPLQLLIHWRQGRRERRKRCAVVNVRFSVTINENSSIPFLETNPNTHIHTPSASKIVFWRRSNREASVLRSNQIS